MFLDEIATIQFSSYLVCEDPPKFSHFCFCFPRGIGVTYDGWKMDVYHRRRWRFRLCDCDRHRLSSFLLLDACDCFCGCLLWRELEILEYKKVPRNPNHPT
ncbi:hypothetical protein Bca4012_044563 [Brassica carinata]|uniref:Uncharacterized protein n=1 Tax=Brassica oleracea var. oleracea TaxID=109376 RepID=A0A0D3EAL7_BRAOL